MRVCSKCGERNEDWMTICQRCGWSIVNADTDNSYSTANRYEKYNSDSDDDSTNSKKTIENLDLKIIIAILSVVLIILSYLAFFT